MAVKAIILVLPFLSLAVVANSQAYKKLADTIGRLPCLFVISVLLIPTVFFIVVVVVVPCIENYFPFTPHQTRRVLGLDSNMDVCFAW